MWKEGSPLTVENITVDPPKTGEVRVRMVSAGLCASDAHLIWGWKTDLEIDYEGHPCVLGHEGAGVVESVGPNVTSVAPGDHVIVMWMPECGKCQLCSNPKTNLCLSDNFYTTLFHANRETRMKINGNPLLSLCEKIFKLVLYFIIKILPRWNKYILRVLCHSRDTTGQGFY